jgi:hypothetical protein
MWNIRSPPFRYSITKNRCSWKNTHTHIILAFTQISIVTQISLRENSSHNKRRSFGEGSHPGLEGGVEVCEEGVVPGQGQDSLLHHGTLHIIIHQNHIFLQGLHSKVLPSPLQLSQQDLERQTGDVMLLGCILPERKHMLDNYQTRAGHWVANVTLTTDNNI